MENKHYKIETQTIFSDETMSINYDGQGILFCCLQGFINMDVVKKYDTKVLSALVMTKCKKILSNTKELGVISKEAKEYNSTVLLNTWKRSGVTHNAVVVPENIFAQWVAEKVKNDNIVSEDGIKIEMFPNEQLAYEWLLSQ